MDIKKIGTQTIGSNADLQRTKDIGKGPSFDETLARVREGVSHSSPQRVSANEAIKFSSHAVERMQSRGIQFSPDELHRIGEAVSKAASKGSRDSLILTDNSALIVSVKNNTVVTVMDKAALKENVFTNIDSTIVM